jgi:signal peptide peptidase SppA
MDSLNRRIEFLTRSPLWCILPDALAAILSQALRGESASGFHAAKSTTHKPNTKMAVIPVQGVLTKDQDWAGTTYGSIADAAERAANDPAVKRIVLAVDSPGGEVTGLPETAAVLHQVAKVKPVSAIVEGVAASAAYWLTSQAHDITVAPSAEVGSVGVRMMHVDVSKMLDDQGYKVTELYSGNFKTEWSPFKPLSDAAMADMQTRLDSVHNDFIKAVAEGRNVAPNRPTGKAANSRYGEGRMFSAQQAMGMGLADKILSPREFYKSVTPTEEKPDAPVFGLTTQRARLALEKARV